jgi:UDP:flavonoid glycosyltransferase YjiC (YdhE family)
VVLVTQGTVKVDPTFLLEPAIEALADDDVLVVGTTGGADPSEILARHPGATNVRLEPFIPFADLLPHVDAVVTNGGYGGTQQALMHGIPVALAGVTEGKLEVCARVAWAGAGINLRTETPTPSQIGEAVRTLLAEPSYRSRAEELAARYAEHDAAAEAAALVEALVGALPGVGAVGAGVAAAS